MRTTFKTSEVLFKVRFFTPSPTLILLFPSTWLGQRKDRHHRSQLRSDARHDGSVFSIDAIDGDRFSRSPSMLRAIRTIYFVSWRSMLCFGYT